MTNSTPCPLCKNGIGHLMDDAHAATVEGLLTALKQAQATIHATWKSLGLSKDGDVAKVFQTVSQAIANAETQ